jgi:hypothetical protein
MGCSVFQNRDDGLNRLQNRGELFSLCREAVVSEFSGGFVLKKQLDGVSLAG